MKCTYSININGKTIILLSDIDENITDINQLEKALKTKAKSDPGFLKDVKELLYDLNSVETINLNDINENSVGLFSPADLINSLSNYRKWQKLDIGNEQVKNVVSGFGKDVDATKFYKGHIFLNLNYVYGSDNKIIALTELALFNTFGDSYELESEKLRKNIDLNNEEADNTIKLLIKNQTNNDDIDFLVKNIKLAYFKSGIKISSDIAESDLTIDRKNLSDTWKLYGELTPTRDLNYLPKSYINAEDLKPGDLVLIPTESSVKGKYMDGLYEIFYDTYIDIQGKTIIRTINKTKEGDTYLRRRVAKKYVYDTIDENNVRSIEESNNVQARVFSNTLYNNYKYNDSTKYEELSVRSTKHSTKESKTNINISFKYLIELLKNPQIKIIEPKKISKGNTEASKSYKLKSLQGSIVTITDGTTTKKIDISEIKRIGFPISKNLENLESTTKEQLKEDGFEKFSTPTIGDIIAFKEKPEDELYIKGKVIAFGSMNDKKIVYYESNKGKISYIMYKNIHYMGNPPDSLHMSVEQVTNAKETIDNFFKGTSSISQNIIKDIKSDKDNKIKYRETLNYSIEEMNEFSIFKENDLIYNKLTGQIHKVVDSKLDVLKTIIIHNGKQIYYNLYKSDLENANKTNFNDFILLTNRINNSFALLNIRKNRYGIYTSNDKGAGSYYEIKVYKNPNGFIYSLAADQNVESTSLYEKGVIDYTEQMKLELQGRYKLSELPKKLYSKTIKNTVVRDNANTLYLPVNNEIIKTFINNSAQTYLVPGSFITLEGRRDKSYLVEKTYKDKILVSYYHYTNNKTNNTDLGNVKSEKFFIDNSVLDSGLNIVGINLPKWATAAYEKIKELEQVKQLQKNLEEKTTPIKNSKLNSLSKSDSPEVIMNMVNLIKEKFGVTINVLHNSELAQFNNPEIYKSAAFVTKDQIYINIDKASVEEPLHELLHLVLATMKANNSDTYYRLVNSVQYHPMFKTIVSNYNDINTELLEETFVKLLSKTFRKNILKEGVFTEDTFNLSIRQSITELLDLTEPLNWEDPFNLMTKSLKEILLDFGSTLIEGEESMIQYDKINLMFDISAEIKTLLKNNKLEQKCNY